MLTDYVNQKSGITNKKNNAKTLKIFICKTFCVLTICFTLNQFDILNYYLFIFITKFIKTLVYCIKYLHGVQK